MISIWNHVSSPKRDESLASSGQASANCKRRAGYWLNYTAKGRRRRLLFAVAISLHTEGKKKYNNPKIRKENNKQIPAATLK